MKNMFGYGVPDANFQPGLPEHNPRPSTERGKRRHHNRNDGQKKAAESAWSRARSTKISKKQEQLRTTGLRVGVR